MPRFFMVLAAVAALAPAAVAETPRIDNPATPAFGIETLVLDEAWRAGGEDDEIFFGNVLQVIAAPDGGIDILDSQLIQVFAYDAAGNFLRTLGAKGEGPGEVNNINRVIDFGDGTLGLGQVLPGKIVIVDRENTPAGAIRLTDPEAPGSGFVLCLEGRARDDLLVVAGMRWSMPGGTTMVQDMFLRSYDREGAARGDYWTKQTAFDTAEFVFTETGYDFVWDRFAIDPAGEVCFAPLRNDYEIHVCRPDGTPARIIAREYESWRRTARESEQAELSNTAIGSHYGRELRGVTVEETEPDIIALQAMDDGRLWVRTSRGDRERPDGVLTTLDVFAGDGTFEMQLALAIPGDPARDGIHLLPDGRVVVVTGAVEAYRRETNTQLAVGGEEAEDVVLEVVCYVP